MMIFLPSMGFIMAVGLPGAIIIAICKSAYDAYLTRLNKQRREKFEQQLQEFMEQDPKYRAARDEWGRLKKEIERVEAAMDPHDDLLYARYCCELTKLKFAERKAKDVYDVKRDILFWKFCENEKKS